MNKIFIELATLAALSGLLSAQCICVPSTAVTDPMINVQGPPTWTAGGTVQDVGTTPGVCVKQGCENPIGCEHKVRVQIDLSYPTGTVPAPSVDVNVKVNNQNIMSFPFPHMSSSVNQTTGITTLKWETEPTNFKFYVDCKASNNAVQVAGDLVFTPPGGGAPTSSGGATMTCSGCGA
jgi:hypothetical protein